MTFPEQFEAWLSTALAQDIPAEVVAYSFNLFEYASCDYGMELIGASEFDPSDADWVCEEVWQPEPRMLDIPADFCSADWASCLRDARALLLSVLDKPGAISARLKASQAVAIGFVDGDLDVIWQR